MSHLDFEHLALDPAPRLDYLVLALASKFGEVDRAGALARLDQLGHELAGEIAGRARGPADELAAVREVLAGRHRFAGDSDDYGNPRNSMLDDVLERRRGLPITLSVVYVEVARRAGIELAGVGLPGHFVAGHFGADPPLLIDPFGGGAPMETAGAALQHARPWRPHAIAIRMLNNLMRSYEQRGDLTRALRAAELRDLLPAGDELRERHAREHAALRARLN